MHQKLFVGRAPLGPTGELIALPRPVKVIKRNIKRRHGGQIREVSKKKEREKKEGKRMKGIWKKGKRREGKERGWEEPTCNFRP